MADDSSTAPASKSIIPSNLGNLTRTDWASKLGDDYFKTQCKDNYYNLSFNHWKKTFDCFIQKGGYFKDEGYGTGDPSSKVYSLIKSPERGEVVKMLGSVAEWIPSGFESRYFMWVE